MKKLLISLGLVSVLTGSVHAGSAYYSGQGNWNVTLPNSGTFYASVSRSSSQMGYANAFLLNQTTVPTTQAYFIEVSPSTPYTSAWRNYSASAGNYTVVQNISGVATASTSVSW